MAKAKAIKFSVDFYEAGAKKYESGKHYAVTDETLREAAKGNAEEVKVDESEIVGAPIMQADAQAPLPGDSSEDVAALSTDAAA